MFSSSNNNNSNNSSSMHTVDGDNVYLNNQHDHDNSNEPGYGNYYGDSKKSSSSSSCCVKFFNILFGICTILLFFASLSSVVLGVKLHSSLNNVGFNCKMIDAVGDIVLAVGGVFIVISLIVFGCILKADGICEFHQKTFSGSSSETSCGKKIFAITNLLVICVFTSVLIIGSFVSFSFFRLSTTAVQATNRSLEGKDGKIYLEYDSNGLPRVHASTKLDALYAQGYLQAQDRLWQLEFTRAVVQGRFAEFVGKGAVKIDKQTRHLGFRHYAEQMCRAASNSTKLQFQRFADGINYYMKTQESRPVEFAFMGKPSYSIINPMRLFSWHEPENFDYFINCYSAKLIQFQMASDSATEAQNFKLWWMNPDTTMLDIWSLHNNYTYYNNTILTAEQLGIQPGDAEKSQRRIAMTHENEARNYQKFFDPVRQRYKPTVGGGEGEGDNNNINIVEEDDDDEEEESLSKFLSEFIGNNKKDSPSSNIKHIYDLKITHASNGWVARDQFNVGAAATDPHLFLSLPSVWYQIHMSWLGTKENPRYSATCVSLAGMSGCGIGRTNKVQWAITAAQTDIEDIFVLNQTDVNSDIYYVDNKPMRMKKWKETLKVLGEDDVTIELSESIYGREVNDVLFTEEKGKFKWNTPNKKAPFRFHMYSTVFTSDDRTSADAFASILDEDITSAAVMRERVASKLYSPDFNIPMVDSTGAISYSMTGRHFERKIDHPGRYPHFGTTKDFYLQFNIPFAELPGIIIPPGAAGTAAAVLYTANQKQYPMGYKYDLGASWSSGYRANRIRDLLKEADPSTYGDISTHQRIQSDHHSGLWNYNFKKAILANIDCFKKPTSTGISDDQAKAWQAASSWIQSQQGFGISVTNGNVSWNAAAVVGDSRISFLWRWCQEYSSIVSPITKVVTGSDFWNQLLFIQTSLGVEVPSNYQKSPFVLNLCSKYLSKHGWSQNHLPASADACIRAWTVAFLRTAVKYPFCDSSNNNNNNNCPENLKWGSRQIKPFVIVNRMMTTSSLKCMFDRHVQKDGDSTTIDVSDFTIQSSNFKSQAASSNRQLYSWKNNNTMKFALPGGSSGNPYSSRYSNLIPKYLVEEYIEIKL